MKLYYLAALLTDINANIVEIDGRLFLDRDEVGIDALKAEIAQYTDPEIAQVWINSIMLDSYIDEICGETWLVTHDNALRILKMCRKAWTYQIRAKFPHLLFRIEYIINEKSRDLGIRLIQEHYEPSDLYTPLRPFFKTH